MENKNILTLIDKSLLELEKFEKEFKLTKYESKVVVKSKLILNNLKDVLNKKTIVNKSLQKKIDTLGLYSFKVFENTPLEDILPEITYYFRFNNIISDNTDNCHIGNNID